MTDAVIRELSIIVPVYSRAWCIGRALSSAQQFLSEVGGGEIVVVDDGSTDDSVRVVESFFATVKSPQIDCRLVRLPRNRGVCVAKNAGAMAAVNYWIVFLDSDDELLPTAARDVMTSLAAHQRGALHFFRCINEYGVNVGADMDSFLERQIDDFIVIGTAGESLPIVKREAFLRFRYDEDINGFESLCYTRMVKALGPAAIHPVVARRYYISHEGRLSSSTGVRRRARSLARGYVRMLREHYRVLGLRAIAHIGVRIAYHGLRAVLT